MPASSSRPAPLRLRRLDTGEAQRPLLPASRTSSMEKNTVTPTESPLVSPSSSVDTDGEDLTLFEKKCLLINRETDGNGMGKYQWYGSLCSPMRNVRGRYVWFLCGFGYLLDLLWAQAFGLILQSLEQELGFSGNESGNISVAFSAGLTAGAFTWGVLVDIIGRKWAFNMTCFITAVFGLGLGGCNSYNAFLVVTAFTGFGIGGNIPIDTTICLECIPQDRRFMLALLSIFQPIGVVITSVLAYAYIPNYSCSPNFSQPNPLPSCKNVADGQPCCAKDSNMGWRYLLFTLGAITLGVFLLRSVIFRFKESPKFLVARGKDRKAVEVLQSIASMNKRSCSVTLSEFEELNHQHKISGGITEADEGKKKTWNDIFAEEGLRYRELFKDSQMTRLTILVWITHACDFWGFTLAGTYLPSILAIKNSEINLSLQHTYRSYIAIYAPGIVGVVVGSMMYGVPTIGRKLAMVISSGLMAASIFIFGTVNSEASNIGLNAMEYFFQSMFNAVLYGWTPEAFPAPIRGTACGIAAFWGRLFSILAPLIAQSRIPTSGLADNPESINTVLYIAGGVSLGCVITTALLPNKVMGGQSM